MTRPNGRKSPEHYTKYIQGVERWPHRKGKKELLSHLNKEELSRKEAIMAKCYECNGGYDEVRDCEIPACPLYSWMPYRKDGERKEKRALTDEGRRKIGERLSKARGNRHGDGKEGEDADNRDWIQTTLWSRDIESAI